MSRYVALLALLLAVLHPLALLGILAGEAAVLIALAVVLARAAGWRPGPVVTWRT